MVQGVNINDVELLCEVLFYMGLDISIFRK